MDVVVAAVDSGLDVIGVDDDVIGCSVAVVVGTVVDDRCSGADVLDTVERVAVVDSSDDDVGVMSREVVVVGRDDDVTPGELVAASAVVVPTSTELVVENDVVGRASCVVLDSPLMREVVGTNVELSGVVSALVVGDECLAVAVEIVEELEESESVVMASDVAASVEVSVVLVCVDETTVELV
jgi:hypothetical protein